LARRLAVKYCLKSLFTPRKVVQQQLSDVKFLQDVIYQKLLNSADFSQSYSEHKEEEAKWMFFWYRCCRFWHETQDYVEHILHRDGFWAISIASGSVILWYFRSCCMVLAFTWSVWRKSWQDPLGICINVHTRNVPKKCQPTWQDYCCEAGLSH